MKPSVGRIVHYVSYGTPGGEYKSQCRAAIITAVYEKDEVTGEVFDYPVVSIAVVNPTGVFFDEMVGYDENKKPGTCHWPERVE